MFSSTYTVSVTPITLAFRAQMASLTQRHNAAEMRLLFATYLDVVRYTSEHESVCIAAAQGEVAGRASEIPGVDVDSLVRWISSLRDLPLLCRMAIMPSDLFVDVVEDCLADFAA